MIVYLDTSALLKLYVDEAGSDETWQAVGEHELSTCRIAWVEAFAALARREREAPAAGPTWKEARRRLAQDWPALHIVDVTQSLAEKAGDLAEAFALRAYGALHLAAAQALHVALREGVSFACFDRRLNRAAQLLGLMLPAALDS